MLAKNEDGIYAAAVGGITVSIPRQVGKTFTVGAIAFALCVNTAGTTVLWTAHSGRTSAETFQAMMGMAKKPKIAPHVKEIRKTNGEEAVIFTNGSRILFGAREHGFGRGFTDVSVVVFDEAQILTEKALDDMVPATNSIENALVIKIGTPPKPENPSEVFKRARRQALAGTADDALYLELGAAEGSKPDDWEQIAKANPSYAIGRTSRTAILRMRKNLSEESFIREAMGIWDEDEAALKAFTAEQWTRNYISKGKVPRNGRRVFAVRFSIDGAAVALAQAVRPNDGGPVYVEGVQLASMGEGTKWLVDWLLKRHKRAAQIVIDGKFGASYLVNALRDGGVTNKKVIITPTTQQVIEAHSTFDRMVKAGEISTIQQDQVEAEALGAERRAIGKDGGFGWAPPDDGSVVLLEAVTYAAWGAKITKRDTETAGRVIQL